MPAEHSAKHAREIRTQFVDRYVVDKLPLAPNKLRGINDCISELSENLIAQGFSKDMLPLKATIGDIDPWEMGFTVNRESDLFEEAFQDLPDRLTLDPEGSNFLRLQEIERQIRIDYKRRGIALTRYHPQGGKGTDEVRDIAVKEAEQIGIETSKEQIWMGYGGLDLLERAARSINVHFLKNYDRQALMLAPSVGFNMAVEAIKDNGLKVSYIDNSDLQRNELTAERFMKYIDEGNFPPDLMLLTPANNPNAQTYEPETFRNFLSKAIEVNPNIIFMFDMAYMWTIPREKAKAIVQVIKDTGAFDKSMFVNSLSKKTAQPGTRLGNIVIPNEELGKIFHRDNMKHIPTWSGALDVLYQATSQVVDEQAYIDLNTLFRQRQKALLDLLLDLDPNEKFFKNLKAIKIPGYEGDGLINQEVPLYLFVELQDGKTAFDVLKELNLGASPSEVFGPENGIGVDKNHIRFSVGFASTYDILSRSKNVLDRWKKNKPVSII